MLSSIDNLIEPDTDEEKTFNLSIKQLTFIQQDNNVKFMNNIMKLMKQHKLQIDDIYNILEKHAHNERVRLEKNENRRLKKNQEVDNNNSLKGILSNKSSKTKSNKKCSSSSKR